MKLMSLGRALVVVGGCGLAASALAQSRAEPDPTKPAAESARDDLEKALPWRSAPDDPIGLSRSDRELDRAATRDAGAAGVAAAEDRQRYGPTPPRVQILSGEVLTAFLPVRESRHATSIRFEAGLAIVGVSLHFTSRSDRPAELRYRLAVPPQAVLDSLTVCTPAGCRDGLTDRSSGQFGAYDDAVQARGPQPALPVAHAFMGQDDRGAAIVIRAAPVSKHADLQVRISYLAQTRYHNGVLRLRLPARGMDPRVAPTELIANGQGLEWLGTARSLDHEQPSIWDSWADIDLSARLSAQKRFRARAWRFECGERECSRAYVTAPTAPLGSPRSAAKPLELLLAIDASPSTEGPARHRMAPAIASVLANAPPGTEVRALVFAARARSLVPEPIEVAKLPLAALANAATVEELGSATRFESAWQVARPWFRSGRRRSKRRLIVIVGDGGLTQGEARPFSEARRAGVEVSVLNVADRATAAALRHGARVTGGIAVDAGAEADQAARGLGTTLLEERVAALFAPVALRRIRLRLGHKTIALGPLRAGEQVTWEGQVGPRKVTWEGQVGPARLTWEGRVGARRVALTVARRRIGVTSPPADMASGLRLGAALAQGKKHASRGLAAVDPADFGPLEAGRPPVPVTGRGCDPRGPAFRQSGISSDEAPVALAEHRSCTAQPRQTATLSKDGMTPGGPKAGAGMPAQPLLSMLRKRIIPVARGCFRRDRAGRPDYQKRAVFRFRLAEREVVSSMVEGDIGETLRRCLLAAVDTLDVPPFSGQVVVRYPLVTEAEPLPQEIELTPQVARQVDAVLDAK